MPDILPLSSTDSTPAPEPTPSKPLLQSKTILFNVLAFVVHAIVAAATGGQLPASYAVFAPLIQAAGNFVLRLVTTQPVSVLSKA